MATAFEPKKKGGSDDMLLALMSKGGKKSGAPMPMGKDDEEEYDLESDPDEADDDTSDSGMAFASFADALGIPEEKRPGAEAALKQYISACTRGDDSKGL